MLSVDLTAWTQLLAFDAEHEARRWEPEKLLYYLLTITATIARRGRRILLDIKETAPQADLVTTGSHRLHTPTDGATAPT